MIFKFEKLQEKLKLIYPYRSEFIDNMINIEATSFVPIAKKVNKSEMIEKQQKEIDFLEQTLYHIRKTAINYQCYNIYDWNLSNSMDDILNTDIYQRDTLCFYTNKAFDNCYPFNYYKSKDKDMKYDFARDYINPRGSALILHHLTNTLLNTYSALKAKQDGLIKGNEGEDYVNNKLSILSSRYIIKQNVVIPAYEFGGQTSETDIYVITSKGILVCEVKNRGNIDRIINISSDGQWKFLNAYTRSILEIMPSPIEQNTRHCLCTEKFLKQKGIPKIKLIPVIIIGNEYVQIENLSSNTVIRVSELYNYIENLNLPEIYTEEQQKQIADCFNSSIKEDNKFDILEIANKENLLTFIDNTFNLLERERSVCELATEFRYALPIPHIKEVTVDAAVKRFANTSTFPGAVKNEDYK